MITPMKSQAARFVRACGCLMISLALTGLALAQGAGNTLAQQDNVAELVECFGGLLIKENELTPGTYLDKLTETGASQFDQDCAMRRVDEYDAQDFASYAMGVSLQRKLLSKHESLNWVDFINGLLRADSSTVRVSNSRITAVLERTLLGDAEASQQYLDEVSESRGVTEMLGVFIKKLPETTDGEVPENSETYVSILDFAHNRELCNAVSKPDEQPLLVKFYQVKPIDRDIHSNGIVEAQIGCIAYRSDDVIRGWRLIVDKLETEEIYDVLIPSELAYGATGVPGMVEGDENLRFLMQVVK